jgi:cholesterol oxidase
MYDAIVIGSGFGGAVTSCRLAERGLRVLILERGQWWTKANYPTKPGDAWVWSNSHPEQWHGWLDLRRFRKVAVAQGAGVGGGSLIYANVSCEAPLNAFEHGWPEAITYNELKRFYNKVADFMNVQKVPANQWNPRMKLMKEAATAAGYGSRFDQLELAVTFKQDLNYDFNDPPSEANSEEFTNRQGEKQGTCAHLGRCDIGCPVYAKNTLDKNYIPAAIKKNAQVRALHLVTNIEPQADGYKVHFKDLSTGANGSETAKRVIVSAGSLGSTELLLRCKNVTKTLPQISNQLGNGWSTNGDFLTPALYLTRALWPDRGPTISTMINFLDGSQNGQRFWVQDGGFPNLFGGYYQDLSLRLAHEPDQPDLFEGLQAMNILQHLLTFSANPDLFKGIMPWFAQGADASDGQLLLDDDSQLDLNWDVKRSLSVFEEILAMHKKLTFVTQGMPLVSPSWELAHDLITPHPLGGCKMADTVLKGVVNDRGEVFGYKNLFVADGAIIPHALGVNPSRTIAALAERIAELMQS